MAHWQDPTPPTQCDVCHTVFDPDTAKDDDSFIDGLLENGPWAIMCVGCHWQYGVGLGTGRGQRYNLLTLQRVEG